jgi:predicted amidohydrolase YtcJ
MSCAKDSTSSRGRFESWPVPRTLATVALLLLAAGSATARMVPKADRIFTNGHVWTGDPSKPRAEAVAVRGTRIIAVGSSHEIGLLNGKATEVVDLKGRWVFPGFNDSHVHFLVVERADLAGASGVAELQRRVGDFAKRHPESPWVLGRGWVFEAFAGGEPHKKLLDAVVPDRPVLLIDRDGHAGWCNSRALELAEVTKGTPDPQSGTIIRDASGAPTGLLKESALELVRQYVPPPNDEELFRALETLLDRAAGAGLTSVQNASFPPSEVPFFERLMRDNALKVRFSWAMPFTQAFTAEDLARAKETRARYNGPLFKVAALKGMVDGTFSSRTAALAEPYVGGATSPPFWTPEELNAAVVRYDREGFQILLHAIGDKAIRMALDAYEAAAKANGVRDRRDRVEHAELPSPADIPRFKALGVIVATQPLFANPEKATLASLTASLGADRAARVDAFKLWDDAGVVQAFGSDWPVTAMDPLRQIYCAVTRTTADGTPPGGWQPAYRVSPETAVRHFTADAAYASFDDKEKGTLTPGKLADLVVLSDDILSPPPERILKTRVLLTVMAGQDTFRERGF